MHDDTPVNQEKREADRAQRREGKDLINPGDKEAPPSATVEEKGEKTAVAYTDMAGNPVEVPTYFVVEDESGEKEALHHVKDAEKISDVIRQARVDENGERIWN
jgi:hypothetical protein